MQVIPSSFRLARNDGKSVVDTPNVHIYLFAAPPKNARKYESDFHFTDIAGYWAWLAVNVCR